MTSRVFPIPRLANNGNALALAFDRGLQMLMQYSHLAVTSDERRKGLCFMMIHVNTLAYPSPENGWRDSQVSRPMANLVDILVEKLDHLCLRATNG